MNKLILEEIIDNSLYLNIVYFSKKLDHESKKIIKKIKNNKTFIKDNILSLNSFSKSNSIISWMNGKIYLSEEMIKQSGKPLKNNYKILQEESKFKIIFIETFPEYRNLGYATRMIKEAGEYCKDKYKTEFIYLDDVTDVSPPRNLYCKLGFEFDISTPPIFSAKWEKWIDNYHLYTPNDGERRIRISALLGTT